MNRSDPTRAACLTPPASGGVAVVQVIGPNAREIVGRHLVSRSPLDLRTLAPDQLRLCRFIEGQETIDDVLVCVRPGTPQEWIVDLNLHGGPRIVQRVLMALRDAGVWIAGPLELATRSWTARDAIEREAMLCLPNARTRGVCAWLLRAQEGLRDALARCLDLLDHGDDRQAGDLLTQIVSAGTITPLLLRGVRIVVTGPPNAGKSTLVNRLAERDEIIVSPVPGTTRDYVEQPASIDGVPAVLVDTAGVRNTHDPLEREAIARTIQQIGQADLVLQLTDASCPPDGGEGGPATEPAEPAIRTVQVWNKVDLPLDPRQQQRIRDSGGWPISAATGEGLVALRGAILEAVGLRGWSDRIPATFTDRQTQLLTRAVRQLAGCPNDIVAASASVRECLTGSGFSADALPSGGV